MRKEYDEKQGTIIQESQRLGGDEELFNCFKVLKKQLGNYATMET